MRASEFLQDAGLLDAFRDRRRDRRYGDEAVVAQALSAHADIIVTNNMRTINHRLVNDWAKTHVGANRDVLTNPEEWAMTMRVDTDAEALLEGTLALSVANERRAPDVERASVGQFLANAGHAFEFAADVAADALESPKSFRRCLDRAVELSRQDPWRSCRALEGWMAGQVRELPSFAPPDGR